MRDNPCFVPLRFLTLRMSLSQLFIDGFQLQLNLDGIYIPFREATPRKAYQGIKLLDKSIFKSTLRL
ncbi:MAG: hypothetical protein ACYC2U_00585 [Candidatus Amoebophilus sp.]